MKLRIRWLGPASALVCELLGLAALGLTPDVEKSLFFAPVLIGLIAWGGRVSLRDRLLLLLVTLFVLGGYATASGAPTGTLMARALIPAHALLWLAADEALYRFWRVGVALLELVLAAILAPEAHMFILIFFFVLLGSLALSLGFLERSIRSRDPDVLERPLRPSFVSGILAVSCVIFLSSLLIFPILPRSHWSGNGETNAGYNDVVNFQQGILRWAAQDTRPALWIFRNGSQPWESIVPYFLLRGQALEKFSGNEWRSSGRMKDPVESKGLVAEGEVEILRQPLPTEILPVPYGAFAVRSESDYPISILGPGEWVAEGSRVQSVRYVAGFGRFRPDAFGSGSTPVNTAFNEKMFPQIAKLAAELGEGAVSDDDKLGRVQKFFRDGGFAYELRAVGGYRAGQKHPLEEFLFDSKRGHCELFASSAAMIYRALGIPARIAVGFRVRSPSRGNVLTVRSSDAHAWVEVWKRGRGWIPVDPTPVAAEQGWVSDAAGEIYDWIGAYWHRYILEYEFDSASALAFVRSLGGAGTFLILALALAFLWRKQRHRRWGNSAREKLGYVLFQFEDDLVHRAGIFPVRAYQELVEVREWKLRYTQLRFGRAEPSAVDLAQLRRMAREIVIRASQEPRSAG